MKRQLQRILDLPGLVAEHVRNGIEEYRMTGFCDRGLAAHDRVFGRRFTQPAIQPRAGGRDAG